MTLPFPAGGTMIPPDHHSEQGAFESSTLYVLHVETDGDDRNDGLSVGDAKATLAAALAVAPAGATIQLGSGVWDSSAAGESSITRSVHITGRGMTTILRGGIAAGFVLKKFGTTVVDDITLSNLAIDLANVATASGFGVEYVTNLKVSRVLFANCTQWMAFVGVNNGADPTIRNSHVIFKECIFSGQGSTTEQLLVFNTSNITIEDCLFTNFGAAAYGLGFYQNVERALVDNCEFSSTVGTGSYYSLSCNHITYRECKFPSGCHNIAGANESDNGTFGAVTVQGLRFEFCEFFSSLPGAAVQYGAVTDPYSVGCTWRGCKEIGAQIGMGNTPVSSQPSRLKFVACSWRDGNTSAASYILHPAVLVTAGGDLHLDFIGCDFGDDQVTKTQRYPVVFEGAVTPARVTFTDCDLWADTANGATSIAVNDGATVGAAVRLFGCRNVSPTLPVGVQSYYSEGRDPLGAAIVAVGASPWAYTAGATPEVVTIVGGTVSSIAKNSVTLFTASPGLVLLQPGESVTVTYTVAPTVTKDRK